jgi:hypothetical protein
LLSWMSAKPPDSHPFVREDLLEFKKVLGEAKQRGLRWPRAVDY